MRHTQPTTFGGRVVGWIEAEIQGWLKDLIQTSRQNSQWSCQAASM